jgi:hypothetical protein
VLVRLQGMCTICTSFLDYGSTVLVVLFLSYIRVSVYYCKDAKVLHLVKNEYVRVLVNQIKKPGSTQRLRRSGTDKNRTEKIFYWRCYRV